MSASTGDNRRQRAGIMRSAGRRKLGVLLVAAFLFLVVGVQQAAAQTPPPPTPPGIEGPWLNIDQIICFTDEDCSNEAIRSGTDYSYNARYGQSFEYGTARREQCYYSGSDGPEAHEVNALYLMMACRVGMGIGGIAWVGTGIGLMALGWTAFRRSIESLSTGGGGTSALKAAIDVPVGILIMFMAFGLATLIYGVARYNFLRYLEPDIW